MNPKLKKILMPFWRALPISEGVRDKIRRIIYKQTVSKNIKNIDETQSVEKTNPEKFVIEKIKFDNVEEKFVPYAENKKINPSVKLIAFYLPQFHPFPENDLWWGKGFTEWYNVGKAEKNYIGHYQPHCPIHNGYYDLRIPEIMEEQARLAKNYGIHGFNYYFYWFAGKTLMEMPLEKMLENKKVDMPFCLTWANENWTRRWDGQENDVLIAQKHSLEDSLALLRYLIKYFSDDRYIKIDGKPVFIVYRASIIPDIKETTDLWRKEIKKLGFDGIYLICAQTFGITSPDEFGFDAAMEFPPHGLANCRINYELELINKNFQGHFYDYEIAADSAIKSKEPDYKLFRTAMLSWDNTARKQDNGYIFHGFSLLRYKQWLSHIVNKSFNNSKYNEQEKIVFVNAWNEWAEGTHLEPDRKYGYGYLNATHQVLNNYDNASNLLVENKLKNNQNALLLHFFFEDLWDEIKNQIDILDELGFDIYVTTPNSRLAGKVLNSFPHANVKIVENRGRDILPFLSVLKEIFDKKYQLVCKIHSKKSLHRNDGDAWRQQIYNGLIGSKENVLKIMKIFDADKRVGIVVNEKDLLKHEDVNKLYSNMLYSWRHVEEVTKKIRIDFKYSSFPAGSMFWMRPEALKQLLLLDDCDFDLENGYVDGTLPHAVERLFCTIVENNGYFVKSI